MFEFNEYFEMNKRSKYMFCAILNRMGNWNRWCNSTSIFLL